MRIVATLLALLVGAIIWPAGAQLPICTTPGTNQSQTATEAEIQACVSNRSALDTMSPGQLGNVLRDMTRSGGSGGGGLTSLSSHSALVAAANTAVTNTISQQGFNSSGDGGAATYQWNASSYCPNGTSGAPVAADGIVCILPSTQSASTAGRYLLQVGASIDVRSVGMQQSVVSEFDNSPYVSALMTAESPTIGEGGYAGIESVFPSTAGQPATAYYFSKSIDVSRTGRFTCKRSGSPQNTNLIFAAGVDGIIQEAYNMSSDGGSAWGQDIDGCHIISLGFGGALMTNGSTAVTGVSMPNFNYLGIPATVWEAGDGIIAAQNTWADVAFSGSLLSVPQGDYVTAVAGSNLTLAQAAVWPSLADGGYTPIPATWNEKIVRLPVEDVYNVTTAAPVTIAASGTWTQPTNVIPISSCSGVILNAAVFDTTLANSPKLGIVANCSGGNLLLAANTTKSSSGSSDNLNFTSNIIQMTGGPKTILMPGDYLWTDAFPFGATVGQAFSPVNFVAAGTTTAPTLTISLTTNCPTTIAYPGLTWAPAANAHVIDVTTNTALGLPASCVNVGGGSTLTVASIPPGVTVSSGDTLTVPVYSTSQPVATLGGKQTIIVANRTGIVSDTFAATTTHTAGSGFMWKLPTGIRMRGQEFSHNNNIGGFVFGIGLGGANGTFPTGGGNNGLMQANEIAGNFIGYISSGDNSGATNSVGNTFGDNHLYDIVEGGTVGSAYFGDNTNSSEAGTAPGYGQVGECGSENFTSFFGMYSSMAGGGAYCLPTDGTLNAPNPTPVFGGSLVNYSPQQASAPDSYTISVGSFFGPWKFWGAGTSPLVNIATPTAAGLSLMSISSNPAWFQGLTITDLRKQALSAATSAAGSGGGSGACTFTVNGGFPVTPGTTNAQFSTTLSGGGIADPLTVVSNGNYSMGGAPSVLSTPANPATVTGTGGCAGLTGATVTVTYGSAIPANTTISAFSVNSLTLSQPLQGAGTQVGDEIQVSSNGQPAPCVAISGGLQSINGIFASKYCNTTGNRMGYQYNATWGGWGFIGDNSGILEVLPVGTDYLGYQAGGAGVEAPAFPHGLLLGGNIASFAPGSERLLDIGAAVPTGTYHLQGNMRLNSTSVPGGNLVWTDTSGFTTTLSGAVTKGTTTSVSVAACPVNALPVATPIIDSTPAVDLLLGTLSSCTGTTLTFQAAASNNGSNGDTIQFMQWEKEGIVQDTIPAISSCGTGSPTVATGSNNLGGQFTLGTGTPTACTITFAHAYPNHAFCAVSPASSGGAAITGGYYISAQSASAFTLTLGTGTSSLVFNYNCTGT